MKLDWKKANKTLLFLLLAGTLPAQAVGQDAAVYDVDSDASRADILVFKGGKLARFGHDHVISTTTINGSVTVASSFSDSTAELTVPLDTLEVDREELKKKYGIDSRLSRSAKMGTRENMLDKVLQATDWPQVSISISVIETNPENPVLNISFNMHGVKQEFKLPASLQMSDDQLHVQGAFGLKQTDYGIKPFSRMGGALRVEDGLKIHFDLLANRRYPQDIQEEVNRE